MKQGQVILAALVIFAAGVITGGLTVRLTPREPVQPIMSIAAGSTRQRADLLDRMQRQLYLTPEQKSRIEQILRDSHAKMKLLWDSIAPQAQEERRRVNEAIRAELLPEQQKQFEAMLQARAAARTAAEERRRHDDRRDPKSTRKSESPKSTNAPKSVEKSPSRPDEPLTEREMRR